MNISAFKRAGLVLALMAVALGMSACTGSTAAVSHPASYAIYGEFAQGSNKLMKSGLNRRVFNTVEAQAGTDIKLDDDGSIMLQPGTYRISGFSITTMQTTFAPPEPQFDSNYPGYALVYRVADENDPDILARAITIGSVQDALNATPSQFNAVFTTTKATRIAVGHQAGEDLHDEVYLSVYEVAGIPSDYHLFAQISITRI